MSPWTRLALVCLLGATALGLLVALVYIQRLRRGGLGRGPGRQRLRPLAHVPTATPPPPLGVRLGVRSVLSPSRGRDVGSSSAGLALAAASTAAGVHGRMGCPTCRREFEPGVRFCGYDARRLVALAEVSAKSRMPGSVCPRCRRAFEAGIRTCAYDSEELMAMPLWEATHGRKDGAPTGVVAKICPQCAVRYDLVMSFCGRDGSELMTIN